MRVPGRTVPYTGSAVRTRYVCIQHIVWDESSALVSSTLRYPGVRLAADVKARRDYLRVADNDSNGNEKYAQHI